MIHARKIVPTLMCGLALWFGQGATAEAADLLVVSSGGFAAAYKELAPKYEKASGKTLEIAWGPSMGDTKDAVPTRLKRGEKIDVLIMVGYALDNLADEGKVKPGSRVVVANSAIGMAVRKGAPKPDISTVDGLRKALLEAKSIAYSDSASGVYIQNEMFKKLGIEDQMKGKARMIPAVPVGEVVARGEAEIGFQQIAELKPVEGLDLVGPLPPEMQQITIYKAGIPNAATNPAVAEDFIRFIASPQAADDIARTGLEPPRMR